MALEWTRIRGSVAAFNAYKSNVGTLLNRPEAPVAVAAGGVICFVAELFNADIVRRFARGPSLQVSQFDKGKLCLFPGREGDEFWTSDQITSSERNILLRHIAGDNQDADRTLWPPPEVFEAGCSHMRGYLWAGALKILNGLKDEYFDDPPNLHWYTASQWHKHFRNRRTGRFKDTKPTFIPDKLHWVEGKDLFARAYPKDWEAIDLADIQIPEAFEPKL
ncbi:hypothetical protein K438DRAFT_1956751 [Mycena galopus ATCC 62051]|nr:hypothetical protein K438DRAFT_1956751 [Mycena galopus ATCC 62051]